MRIVLASIMLAAAALPATARAQQFPADADYFPLYCGDGPSYDGYQDESGALDERDIVGDAGAPAVLRAADDTYLYLRLRLDEDPAPGGVLRPFAWGMAIDLDGDITTYELLLMADGLSGGDVTLYRNTTTTLANDPTDPADEPPVAIYAFATHGRSAPADSSYGNSADHFLDFALPWDDLVSLGFDRDSPVYVWAASSSTAASLNGDFACHDGASGDPTLDEIASGETVPDPVVDSDGDGFTDDEEANAGTDPDDPNDFPASRLEGGGGCNAGGQGGPALALALLLLALAGRRRAALRPRGAAPDGGP
jgi:uncharacterized protein (TIGR03382 family)